MPPDTSSLRPAALGLRTHSGWAVVVAVAASGGAPDVILRRKIEIADRRIAGSVQPYHTMEGWTLPRAEEFLERCRQASLALARGAVEALLREAAQRGYRVVRAGLLLSSGRPTGSLADTLASHAKIHTAEGEFYRDSLRQACEACKVPVKGLIERTLPVDDSIRAAVNALAKTLGPPWRQDEKLATLAAWLALR